MMMMMMRACECVDIAFVFYTSSWYVPCGIEGDQPYGGAPSLSETGTYIDIYHRFFMQGEAKKAAHKRLENLEYKRLKSSCTGDMATQQTNRQEYISNN